VKGTGGPRLSYAKHRVMDISSCPLTVGTVSSANSTGASTLSASPRTCHGIAIRGWSIVINAGEIVDGHPLASKAL
jgi:hypothetical protein